MSSPIKKEHCEFIIKTFPETRNSNTKFLQRFYEQTCISRGLDITWENIKKIQDEDYAQETVVRTRRLFIQSTESQKELGEKVRNDLAKDVEGVPIEDILECLP